MNILIVEDDVAMLSLLKEWFEREDCEVTVASTAWEALDVLRNGSPEFIILDRGLPDLDGLDLCRNIRRTKEWSKIPILFVSERQTPRDIAQGLRMGGDDYMAKPFDLNELLARVRAVARRAALSPC